MSATIDPPKTSTDSDDNVTSEANGSTPSRGERRSPKKKPVLGKFGRSTLMLVRRVHLYSGIFMFPFVLLYGFTGWFFNHPRMFTGDRVTAFAPADVSSETLGNMPTAHETAQSIVDEMNLESFLVGGPEIKLTDDRSPRYSGYLAYTVSADDATHDVRINPVTGKGQVRTNYVEAVDATAEPKPNPLAEIRRIELPSNAAAKIQDDMPKILSDLRLSPGEAFSGRRSASLVFSAEADGVLCIVTCDLASGTISSIRDDDRPPLETKSFLQRLHLARMYSPDFDIRWVWALLVDAMFVSMVFWGLSGLMMWWQVKRTRVLGAGVLVASIVFTAVLAIGMHDNLTSGSRGGRGGDHGGGNRGGGMRGRAEMVPQQPTPVPKTQTNAAIAVVQPRR
jgi:hypothetical protein